MPFLLTLFMAKECDFFALWLVQVNFSHIWLVRKCKFLVSIYVCSPPLWALVLNNGQSQTRLLSVTVNFVIRQRQGPSLCSIFHLLMALYSALESTEAPALFAKGPCRPCPMCSKMINMCGVWLTMKQWTKKHKHHGALWGEDLPLRPLCSQVQVTEGVGQSQ